MRTKTYLLGLLLAASVPAASAASDELGKTLRINEVMVENQTSITDDYGERVAWIELYNRKFGPLEISSVYLTTDRSNLKAPGDTSKINKATMYKVPIGDERTHLGKRQMVVFFADSLPTRGTFHTNFRLEPGKPNWIGLFAADGKKLLDSVTVPPIAADASYACIDGPDGEVTWEVRNGSREDLYITPGGQNTIQEGKQKVETFAQEDPNGFAMAAMAMGIVFSALLVLALSFLLISKIGESVSRKNKAKSQGVQASSDEATVVAHDSGEEIAAIVMALHQHLNAHDKESTVLTINKVKRAYSPWNSKIYNMRSMPKN